MLETISIAKNPASIAATMRHKRMALFQRLVSQVCPVNAGLRILDMGGTPRYWLTFAPEIVQYHNITIVNAKKINVAELAVMAAKSPPINMHTLNMTCIEGDACALPQFKANAFDIVFSNSVIEHVGDLARQQAMANEVRRLAPAYFVQTPNYWFPMEPHMLVPGFQWMPIWLRIAILRYTPLARQKFRPAHIARKHATRIRLLSRYDLRYLFPEADIVPERWHGLAKSWIAIHRPPRD